MKTISHKSSLDSIVAGALINAGIYAKQRKYSKVRILRNQFLVAICLYFMVACSVLQKDQPITELASIKNQHSANALLALWDLEAIDTLVKLDNRWLASQFETVLQTRADLTKSVDIRKTKLIFNSQIIELDLIINVSDEDGNTISTSLSGDVNLEYRSSGLEWRPRFRELQVNSSDFIFDGISYSQADQEFTGLLLHRLRRDLGQSPGEYDGNTIPLNPLPLGEVQVGATLPGFSESVAVKTQTLRGVFMIAGSSTLIDSSYTTIALDLTFIPELSTCPADVTVARAEFTTNVQSREPVGIARNLNNAADVRYFYSEIKGAKRPMTIIHYWFEDGLPLAAEELAVGASERWRTWSSKGTANNDASQWEVLIVEKESGCILTSKSIRKPQSETLITRVNPAQARETFEELKGEFIRRTSGFSIVAERPGIALIETRRPFLTDVLQASLADLNMDAEFDESGLSALSYSAQLEPFDTDDTNCERHDCPPAPVCGASLTQCKRLRDTRDCSSCQFRNPLNNRCISEAIDPLCEAARTRQNTRYEDEYSACVDRVENKQRECDRLSTQAFRSCQIESGFEESACQAAKSELEVLEPGSSVALVNTRTQARGSLSAGFSNFLIEGDLERLQMDISLKSNLQLNGEMVFKPSEMSPSVAKCISAWSGPFKSRFVSTPQVNKLLSDFETGSSILTAQWSGFGITIETQPSPLEAIFVDNPQLLANCKIGLTVGKIEGAVSGEDAEFFKGGIDLLLQPSPTRIHLAPATIESGNRVHSSEARLTPGHLLYDITE